MRFLLAILCTGAALCQIDLRSAAADDETAYPIKMHRPVKVGERYTYAAVGRLFEMIDVKVDGESRERQDTDYRCELASMVEILAVDKLGLPTEIGLTVYRFQKQASDEKLALDLLGRGTRVLCQYTAEGSKFLVDGKEVDQEVAEALSIVAMKMSSQFGETDDQVLGIWEDREKSKMEKKERESWEINRGSVATALARNGFHTRAADLKGTSQLTSAATGHGGPAKYLTIDTTISSQKISPELPEGYKLKSGVLANSISRRYPTDLELPCSGEEISFEIVAEAEGKEAGSVVTLKIELKQTLKARYARIGDAREE